LTGFAGTGRVILDLCISWDFARAPEAEMSVHDPLAVQSIAESTFNLYRAAILLSGLALVALAAWGFGATGLARVFSGVVGVIFVGYAGWLWLFLEAGELYEVYPWLFILPVLVVGYHFYTRVLSREIDASVHRQLEEERAARRAARAAAPQDDAPSGDASEER
jgi:hypothetical protein